MTSTQTASASLGRIPGGLLFINASLRDSRIYDLDGSHSLQTELRDGRYVLESLSVCLPEGLAKIELRTVIEEVNDILERGGFPDTIAYVLDDQHNDRMGAHTLIFFNNITK